MGQDSRERLYRIRYEDQDMEHMTVDQVKLWSMRSLLVNIISVEAVSVEAGVDQLRVVASKINGDDIDIRLSGRAIVRDLRAAVRIMLLGEDGPHADIPLVSTNGTLLSAICDLESVRFCASPCTHGCPASRKRKAEG